MGCSWSKAWPAALNPDRSEANYLSLGTEPFRRDQFRSDKADLETGFLHIQKKEGLFTAYRGERQTTANFEVNIDLELGLTQAPS